MGTIAVAKKGSQICIAANCWNTRDQLPRSQITQDHSCILKVGESYIGLHSSLAFQQSFESVLRNAGLKAPSLNSSSEINQFFTKIHEVMRNHGYMYVNYQQGQEFEWTPMNALVANRSGIYKVDSTRGVFEFSRFWALGTGEHYAEGAMHACYDTLDDAEKIVEAGLSAAADLEAGQRTEITFFTIATPQLVVSATAATEKPKKARSNKGKKLSIT